MEAHDPYGPMLEELRSSNDSDEDGIFIDSLHQLQPYIISLRKQYRRSPSDVDFSCPHTRAAYLLAYYPYYIEPLYCILSRLFEEIGAEIFNIEHLRVCFIGSGPAPEALGLVAYLQDYCPDARCVTGYLLDKYVDGWRLGQEVTRYHLAPHYWPNGKLVLFPVEFDFLTDDYLENPFADRAIRHSHLFIIQNCLNDLLDNPNQAKETVLRIFRLAPIGSLLIICDLNFKEVRDLIRDVENMMMEEEIGTVILPVRDECEILASNITIPRVVIDHLLTGIDALIPKKYTSYYFSVVLRVEPKNLVEHEADESEIMF